MTAPIARLRWESYTPRVYRGTLRLTPQTHCDDPAYARHRDRKPLPGMTAPAPAKLGVKVLIIVLHPQAMALAVVSFRGRP